MHFPVNPLCPCGNQENRDKKNNFEVTSTQKIYKNSWKRKKKLCKIVIFGKHCVTDSFQINLQ